MDFFTFYLFTVTLAVILHVQIHPGAAVGSDCTVGGDTNCTSTERCNTNTKVCECNSVSYLNAGGTDCILKSGHGGPCGSNTEVCDGRLRCVNSLCVCQDGNYYKDKLPCISSYHLTPSISGYSSTYNSFTVTWTRIDDPAGYSSRYTLEYTGPASPIDITGNSGSETTQEITGTSKTTYRITIKRYLRFRGTEQSALVTSSYLVRTKSGHGGPCGNNIYDCDYRLRCVSNVCVCPDGNYYQNVLPCISSSSLVPAISSSTSTYNSFTVIWTRPDNPTGYSSRYTLAYQGVATQIDISGNIGSQTTQDITGTSNTTYSVTINRYLSSRGVTQSALVTKPYQVKTKSSHDELCNSNTDCATFSQTSQDLICYPGGQTSVCVCPNGQYYGGNVPCSPINNARPSFDLTTSDLESITLVLKYKPPVDSRYTSTYAAQLTPGNIIHDLPSDSTRITGLTAATVYRVTVRRTLTLTGVGRTHTTDPSPAQDDSTKVSYNNTCITNGTCIDVNTDCYGGRCLCDPGYYWRDGTCNQISELTPRSVQADTLDTTRVTVTWTPPPNSGYVSGYRVDATPTDQHDPDPPAVEVTGGAMTSRTLTGLQPGTQYIFIVESKSENDGRVEYVPGNNSPTSVTKPAPISRLDEGNSNFTAPDMKIAFQPAEQKFISYTVTLRGETDGYYQQVTAAGSIDGYYFVVFRGVTSGNYYNITVVTNSVDNSQSEPFTKRQRVMADQASEVVDLTTGPLTSRSVVVSWKRPRKPNGLLFEYSLEISQDGVCKSRIVFNCTQCSRNSSLFYDTATSCPSPTMIDINKNDINDPSHVVVHNITSLDPDTRYTIQAVAYTQEGRGRGQTPLQVHTNSEPARAPTSVTTHDITSNTVTVSWVPESPRPGQTSYVVEVHERNEDNEEFSLMKSVPVLGYNNNTLKIQGLSSYWEYTFSVNSQSEVRPASAFVSTGVITTSESAPTEVVNLEANTIPDVYDKVRLSWRCPPQKDGRNGVIQTASVRYESEDHGEGVIPKTGEETFDVTQSCSWDSELDITVGVNYTFMVFISNRFEGAPRVVKRYMPAGPPPLNNGNQPLIAVVSGSASESIIAVDFCTLCLFNNQNGIIIRTGLLVCRLGHCPINGPSTKQASYYDNLPNWDKAKGVAFTSMYRATEDDWMKGVQPTKSQRFVLGDEDCSRLEDQTRFCNGPLPKDTYRMWLFACTSVGCSEGRHLEFTLKDNSLPASTVGAIVASVLVVVIIIVVVVVYIKVLRPRSQRQRRKKYQSNTSPNDDTYADIAEGNRLSVIQDGQPEVDYYNTKDSPPRSENTYNQLTVYSNQGYHDYGQIKVTRT